MAPAHDTFSVEVELCVDRWKRRSGRHPRGLGSPVGALTWIDPFLKVRAANEQRKGCSVVAMKQKGTEVTTLILVAQALDLLVQCMSSWCKSSAKPTNIRAELKAV